MESAIPYGPEATLLKIPILEQVRTCWETRQLQRIHHPDGEYLVNPDGQLNPSARLRYNDSFADAMFRNAFRQEYNVSASGGNDRTDYYVSMGYLDNDSYILGSSYKRFTARANVNSQLKPWLKVGTNIGYSKTEQNGVNETNGAAANPFDVARSWAPIFPVHAYDAEGNLKYDENGLLYTMPEQVRQTALQPVPQRPTRIS